MNQPGPGGGPDRELPGPAGGLSWRLVLSGEVPVQGTLPGGPALAVGRAVPGTGVELVDLGVDPVRAHNSPGDHALDLGPLPVQVGEAVPAVPLALATDVVIGGAGVVIQPDCLGHG